LRDSFSGVRKPKQAVKSSLSAIAISGL